MVRQEFTESRSGVRRAIPVASTDRGDTIPVVCVVRVDGRGFPLGGAAVWPLCLNSARDVESAASGAVDAPPGI
eukprot:3625750-Pyramimonas_sp.AAC.1